MNRPIKFRAWDNLNRRMYVDELESMNFAKNGNPANIAVERFIGTLVCIGDDPQCVLMQFTGLHDENGKEIYEGDIVVASLNGSPHNFQVVYDIERAAFRIADEGTLPLESDVTVIGNIYENPNLLAS